MEPTLTRPTMRYWRLQPDARLRPAVLCYYFVEPRPPRDATRVPSSQELLLPDGHAELVFMMGAAFTRSPVGEPPTRAGDALMRGSYVIGGRSHSVLTRDVVQGRIAGVKLDPRLLRHLAGLPLDEFADATLPLADLGDAPLLALEDRIARARDAREAAACFDEFLLARLPRARRADHVDALRTALQRSHGKLPILAWSREQRVDARHLERSFRAALGVTPKRFARVLRFKHHYHRLVSGGTPLSAVQLDGYCDQSHFNKDFRYFTGGSPGARLAGIVSGTSISDHLLAAEMGSGGAPLT